MKMRFSLVLALLLPVSSLVISQNARGWKYIKIDSIGEGGEEYRDMYFWRNDTIKSLEAGMQFRDYPWDAHMSKDDGKFLRVGGKLDYSINGDFFPQDQHKDGFLPMLQKIDLKGATGAEVIVERIQVHEGTQGLTIQFNNGDPIPLPEPETIPKPAIDYLFDANIMVPVPLLDLKQGTGNAFRFKVSKEQPWNWPENLIYGVILRIYYNNELPASHMARIAGISDGDGLGNSTNLTLRGKGLNNITKVDYIGLYEDINVQGDGRYRQWQSTYHRGKIENNIGSSSSAPFSVVWNTAWLPDQDRPVQLTALVTDKNGIVHVLSIVKNLYLNRNYSVALIKPYGQEPKWTTRSGEHSQFLNIPFDISKTDTVKLYWNSWSPCYSEGMTINGGNTIKDSTKMPCYDAYQAEETLTDISSLKKGQNKLTTLKTPLIKGEMMHGMDVQWPGVMLKIKRENPSGPAVSVTDGITRVEQSHHLEIEP